MFLPDISYRALFLGPKGTQPVSVQFFNPEDHWSATQRVLGTVMGDTSLNHNITSSYRNPTFYYIGTWDPLGYRFDRAVSFNPTECFTP